MRTALVFLLLASVAQAQNLKSDIPYADPAHERQVLDIYAPDGAKNLPVVFWIHGGGWQAGDKTDVQIKPRRVRRARLRVRLDQLPAAARGGNGRPHSRRRQVPRLGAQEHRRARRRSGADLRHGAFRRCPACGPALHRRSLLESRRASPWTCSRDACPSTATPTTCRP